MDPSPGQNGDCCLPMDLMRSEEMQLVQVIVLLESSHLTISYIGDFGLLQFKDELVSSDVLPENFLSAIKNSDYSSGTTKINIDVDRLPQFHCCNSDHYDAGPEHMGTIHIGSKSMEKIDLTYKDALNGIPSKRPIIEMTIPSALDRTISPPGQPMINLFVQYTPYNLSEGSWQDHNIRGDIQRRRVLTHSLFYFIYRRGSYEASEGVEVHEEHCSKTYAFRRFITNDIKLNF